MRNGFNDNIRNFDHSTPNGTISEISPSRPSHTLIKVFQYAVKHV